MKNYITALFTIIFTFSYAQPPASTSEAVSNALEKKSVLSSQSWVKNLPLTCIGPTIMSGRVVDLDVNPNNPSEFYVAYASGGLWYTNNNGTSFEPVMDAAPTQHLGDIAVDWQNGILWAGTGENNSSRSSYAGIGILKSTDHGKTWINMGLADSHHIGRIIINPNDPDEVLVGVTGHLYSNNEERGIYKTLDGGKTWQRTLFVADNTGVIDLAFVPDNFQIQFATAWEKDRKAWHFEGSGGHSGIYKSTDGGSSWSKISTEESGFPTGNGVGRIGLAIFDENTIYAVHDNQFRRQETTESASAKNELTKDSFKKMSNKDFLELDNSKLNGFLKTHGFHEKYRAQNLKNMVREGSAKPADIALYLEDANSQLIDTPVIGAEVYLSKDGGKSWQKQNEDYIDGLYYSYGYYFGQISVDPSNKDRIFLSGVPLIMSEDGGKTYTAIDGENVHGDHHNVWVNPNKPGHLINGNDGGVNITYDFGKNWIKNNSVPVGQFYAINIDHQEPYNVYGGLQDNGVWKGAHNSKMDNSWQQSGKNPWESLMGGDGMQIQIDRRNPKIVFTGFQFGNYYRLDLEKEDAKAIQPKHELGESPYRFNWQTPILLSEHNQDILYLGGNKLHRSLNQGDDWATISEDLTNGGQKGNVAFGTLTSISESPFQFGLLYTGSDDGMVHLSKNGGAIWQNISKNLPKDLWVSRVAASQHKKERVYVALNGYRWDDFNTYIYQSNDYGQNWKSLASNIPASPVNVILEDTENENLLFVGTDNGLYVSFDQGSKWHLMENGLPPVAVHDLVIQPEKGDLLVGTHGRSIYRISIKHLQALNGGILEKPVHVFEPEKIRHSDRWGNAYDPWSTPRTPGLDFTFYSKSAQEYNASIQTIDGIEVSNTVVQADTGFNILSYDVAFSKTGKSNYLKKNKRKLKEAQDGKTYLPKGTYKIVLTGKGISETAEFEIK